MEISSNGGKNVLFVVRLCSDVVLEVLCWGDRRQLALLEKLGKRFHLLIDRSFEGAPFLRLDLYIEPLRYIFIINRIRFLILLRSILENYFSNLIRLSDKEICQTDLLTIPPFFRFNSVTLYYDSFECTSMKLKDGCEWTQMILQPLKPALKGAKFDFTDTGYNSMLHTHLEQELLPICDNCRSYRFEINLCGHSSSAKELISKFLQFDQINCCSNVLFHVCISD